MTSVAAFFDLDGTLLSVNSMRLWVTHQRSLGLISRRDALVGAWYTLLYRFTFLDMQTLAERALSTMVGLVETEFEQGVHGFFHDTLRHYIPRNAQPFVDEHRAKGHKVVLLTSASAHEARAAARQFNLDDYICTNFEVKDGRFTGKAIPPVCYAEGKVWLAEAWAEEHGVSLCDSYFYSDSFSDAPMLRRVGHPRVVNPDLRLHLMAKMLGWRKVDWS
ncbi:MAG: HAD-IB family hydrolase [Myxococcota bacterium]|jgi:HAD superfamily hydrolase (TIGR01490 family)|nr:HAD-IB family hydrolase [Myxococcota bacterium]